MSSEIPKPPVYTPFLRRFTDESARDLSETIALYNQVRNAHFASVWAKPDSIERINGYCADIVRQLVSVPSYLPLLQALDHCQTEIIKQESTIVSFPEIDWSRARLSMKEEVDLRRFLRAKQHFLANDERVFQKLVETLCNIFGGIIGDLPKLDALGDERHLVVPLITIVSDPKGLVDRIIGTVGKGEVIDNGLFISLQKQLYENICRASGVDPDDEKPRRPLITADEADLPPAELVAAYLAGTPFKELLLSPVPLVLPERLRFEHTVVIAGSGWGKTQLLQSIIADDLQKDDPPALVIIDSTGGMVERIQKLAVFDGSLRDRILIIDPAFSPSLNLFDVSTPRFHSYTPDQREDIQTEIVSLFNYIFASEEYDLTSQMGLAFTYAVRLMLSRDGATITDLRRLLEETPRNYTDSSFKADIERLDPDTKDFFIHHFFADSLKATRASIARRIHSLTAVPAFRRMFTATANSLDLFSEMQKGTIVLVNTNQSLLKDDGMVLFGRYIIALALGAALERATIPDSERRPAFLIVDEAAPYFDDSFEKLLTRVRQFKLGVVIAFQHLEQANEKLKSALASSTSVKYAAGVGYNDRRWLAHDMETTPEFIAARRKDTSDPPRWTQFALYARNHLSNAISVTVPFYALESMPKMSVQAHRRLLERNKQRTSVITVPKPATAPAHPPVKATTPPTTAQDSPRNDSTDAGEPSASW